jgi:hypothetical protein
LLGGLDDPQRRQQTFAGHGFVRVRDLVADPAGHVQLAERQPGLLGQAGEPVGVRADLRLQAVPAGDDRLA